MEIVISICNDATLETKRIERHMPLSLGIEDETLFDECEASHDHIDALLLMMVLLSHCEIRAAFTCMVCMSQHFCVSIVTSKWRATMASFLHLHRLCSNAGSLRLPFRRTFANDNLDPSENAIKKVQDAAKKASQKFEDAKGAAKSTTKSVADKAKHQAEKAGNTARDKVKEAVKGVKEVGVEAAKSVKRDELKAAEKVGIKDKKKSR